MGEIPARADFYTRLAPRNRPCAQAEVLVVEKLVLIVDGEDDSISARKHMSKLPACSDLDAGIVAPRKGPRLQSQVLVVKQFILFIDVEDDSFSAWKPMRQIPACSDLG